MADDADDIAKALFAAYVSWTAETKAVLDHAGGLADLAEEGTTVRDAQFTRWRVMAGDFVVKTLLATLRAADRELEAAKKYKEAAILEQAAKDRRAHRSNCIMLIMTVVIAAATVAQAYTAWRR